MDDMWEEGHVTQHQHHKLANTSINNRLPWQLSWGWIMWVVSSHLSNSKGNSEVHITSLYCLNKYKPWLITKLLERFSLIIPVFWSTRQCPGISVLYVININSFWVLRGNQIRHILSNSTQILNGRELFPGCWKIISSGQNLMLLWYLENRFSPNITPKVHHYFWTKHKPLSHSNHAIKRLWWAPLHSASTHSLRCHEGAIFPLQCVLSCACNGEHVDANAWWMRCLTHRGGCIVMTSKIPIAVIIPKEKYQLLLQCPGRGVFVVLTT